ncbi:MAG: radical SAM protein [Muribaculaceae bacterium]|nr:radical SAM protein [Muribaculaceae bacterium]
MMIRELKAPIYAQWEVTPKCNYQCIHCYNGWRKHGDVPSDISIFPKIVDEIIKNEIFSVTITGGEPIIVFEELKPYLMKLGNAGITMSLNTNASLITHEIAKGLKTIGINNVLVSVPSGSSDVFDQITGSKHALERTMKGIHHLLDNEIMVSVNMVISLVNIHTIYDTAKIFKDLPIKFFAATRAATPCDYEAFSKYRIDNKQLKYMFDELLRVKEEFQMKVSSLEFYPYCAFCDEKHFDLFGNRICNAGKTEIAISYDGTVKPCSHTVVSYGSIEKGINMAWKRMHDDWRTQKLVPVQCSECMYRLVCAGGCKQEAYSQSHSLQAVDPIAMPVCEYRKKKQTITLKECYFVNVKLRVREESNGTVILYVQDSGWRMVRKELADILVKQRCIDCGILCEHLHISKNESEHILTQLVKSGIVI